MRSEQTANQKRKRSEEEAKKKRNKQRKNKSEFRQFRMTVTDVSTT